MFAEGCLSFCVPPKAELYSGDVYGSRLFMNYLKTLLLSFNELFVVSLPALPRHILHTYQGQYFHFTALLWCSLIHIPTPSRIFIRPASRPFRNFSFPIKIITGSSYEFNLNTQTDFFMILIGSTAGSLSLCFPHTSRKVTPFKILIFIPFRFLPTHQMAFWTFTSIWCCHENQFLFFLVFLFLSFLSIFLPSRHDNKH